MVTKKDKNKSCNVAGKTACVISVLLMIIAVIFGVKNCISLNNLSSDKYIDNTTKSCEERAGYSQGDEKEDDAKNEIMNSCITDNFMINANGVYHYKTLTYLSFGFASMFAVLLLFGVSRKDS